MKSSGVYSLSQLFSGFGSLRRQGLVDADLVKAASYRPGLSGTQLSVVVEGEWGRCNALYDVTDGEPIAEHDLEACDLYFKRSYSKGYVSGLEEGAKVRRLGLNYPVYSRGDWALRRARWSFGSMRRSNARQALVDVARLSGPLSRALGLGNGRYACATEAIEARPAVRTPPRVLFLTRTWDPSGARGERESADDFRQVSDMRARCVRSLRKELGPAFTGGLAPTEHAVSNYPDCIVDHAITRKPTFLRLVKTSDICVATAGLRGSNSWRLGEYVAASRAIVTEQLHHEVPGRFVEGENYLGFSSPEECVERTLELIEDPSRRAAMMRSNHRYYHGHVRPDALVWNSLRRVREHMQGA